MINVVWFYRQMLRIQDYAHDMEEVLRKIRTKRKLTIRKRQLNVSGTHNEERGPRELNT